MKIYNKQNVWDAAIERINFLFDEFPNVIVGYSGGKDSTVCFNLSLMIARERNRLPLNVMWIDQEAEWQGTVDICTKVMTHPDVKPYWFQMPMVITNNANSYERYFYCWAEERKDEWIHPQHPISIKENRYGTERFHQLFTTILAVEFPSEKTCYISGVRTDEAPKRFIGLTTKPIYKWITWGSVRNKKKQHYTFYPIYDWVLSDVWKAIYDNGWEYNRIYDELYRNGLPLREMRISSVHHETSKHTLQYIQEIEPETWERITKTLPGANTINQIKKSSFTCPSEYPFMFNSWEEYTAYLIDNIIQEEKNREMMKKIVNKLSLIYVDDLIKKTMYRVVINTILSSDWDLTMLDNFRLDRRTYGYRQYRQGQKQSIVSVINNPYIPIIEKERMWALYEKGDRRNPEVC